jgi:hypothetical protein
MLMIFHQYQVCISHENLIKKNTFLKLFLEPNIVVEENQVRNQFFFFNKLNSFLYQILEHNEEITPIISTEINNLETQASYETILVPPDHPHIEESIDSESNPIPDNQTTLQEPIIPVHSK